VKSEKASLVENLSNLVLTLTVLQYIYVSTCFLYYVFQTILNSKRGEIVSTDAPSMLVYVDAHSK
jgi:hypothetical protein